MLQFAVDRFNWLHDQIATNNPISSQFYASFYDELTDNGYDPCVLVDLHSVGNVRVNAAIYQSSGVTSPALFVRDNCKLWGRSVDKLINLPDFVHRVRLVRSMRVRRVAEIGILFAAELQYFNGKIAPAEFLARFNSDFDDVNLNVSKFVYMYDTSNSLLPALQVALYKHWPSCVPYQWNQFNRRSKFIQHELIRAGYQPIVFVSVFDEFGVLSANNPNIVYYGTEFIESIDRQNRLWLVERGQDFTVDQFDDKAVTVTVPLFNPFTNETQIATITSKPFDHWGGKSFKKFDDYKVHYFHLCR